MLSWPRTLLSRPSHPLALNWNVPSFLTTLPKGGPSHVALCPSPYPLPLQSLLQRTFMCFIFCLLFYFFACFCWHLSLWIECDCNESRDHIYVIYNGFPSALHSAWGIADAQHIFFLMIGLIHKQIQLFFCIIATVVSLYFEMEFDLKKY